jgi:hypothetical protein
MMIFHSLASPLVPRNTVVAFSGPEQWSKRSMPRAQGDV